MSTQFKYVLIFVAGAAVGAAASFKYAQTKYEKITQDEIASIKSAFSEPTNMVKPHEPEGEKTADDISEKTDMMGYAAELQKSGYTNYSNSEVTKTPSIDDVEKPYVISPDDFGEFYDYEKISLTHYEDDILTDEDDEIVDNVDDTVGSDYARHFGDYEPDAVHIRNDRKKCDYEILRDLRRYSDVIGVPPR